MTISVQTSAQGAFVALSEAHSSRRVSRVELVDAFVAAEPLWRQLESAHALATPYQSSAWINHWFDRVGRPSGVDPLVIAGLDHAGTPLFVVPLIREVSHGCAVARFCGGTHANLNMAIWRADVASSLTAQDVRALLHEVARARRIDLFSLLGQPPFWRGVQI